ncbi:MAG TPA: ribosome biogenesis GTPase Der [Candidatus Saccharimonadales bacterium]|nr:ribosome biogenesis GTPase Der [Candidatus Saccharimonadales bacterium]
MKKVPIVAIVGRANVGKSSLFNAILRRREAIVAREAGTTRDSITARAEYKGQDFWLVDTAGMKSAEDDFELTIQEQIIQATDSADVIWVVIEADAAITDEDRRVATLALKSRKLVYLVVNKSDKQPRAVANNYLNLGIKPVILTSTTQNQGIDELLDQLIDQIPRSKIKVSDDRIHLAILGRPNVGKSALFNAMAKKQQAIVAARAGTTRDVNRTVIGYKQKEIELMDTAGIRRSGKIEQGIEQFSVLRSLSAIEQADVCLLLMDVNELGVALDQKIAGLIKEAGKGLILVISKWDTMSDQKTPFTRDELAAKLKQDYNFVPWASLIFTSSVTGQNVTKIFDLVLDITDERFRRIKTAELNQWLKSVTVKHPPAGLKNRAPKLNYIIQENDNPTPSFKVFGSHTKFIHWSYKRYMERELRQRYGFNGTAIKFWFIEKHVTHKHGDRPKTS